MKLYTKVVSLLSSLIACAGCDTWFDVEGRFRDANGKKLNHCWAEVYAFPEKQPFHTVQFIDRTIARVAVGPVTRKYSFALHCPEKYTIVSKGPFLFRPSSSGPVEKFDFGYVVFPR